MNTRPIRLAALALVAAGLAALPVDAQTYTLPASVVSSGGTSATGNGYTLRGTVGQISGFTSNATHTLGAGFWYQVTGLDAAPRHAFVEALAPLGLILQAAGTAPVVAGGALPLAVALTVGPDGPSAFDYWAEVTLPDGRVVPAAGPSVALVTPGTTVGLALRQMVPASAPSGGYTYTLFAGQYPDEVFTTSTLALAVAGSPPVRHRQPAQEVVVRQGHAQERAAPDGAAQDRRSQHDEAPRTRRLEQDRAPAAARPAHAPRPAAVLVDARDLAGTLIEEDRWLAYDVEGRPLAPGTVSDLRTGAAEAARADRADAAAPTEAAPASSAAGATLPAEVALAPAYPNPFRAQARLRFALPEAAAVRLVVYDALGRTVAVLADGEREAGWHEAAFDGDRLAAGLYVVRLEAGGQVRTQRLTRLR